MNAAGGMIPKSCRPLCLYGRAVVTDEVRWK